MEPLSKLRGPAAASDPTDPSEPTHLTNPMRRPARSCIGERLTQHPSLDLDLDLNLNVNLPLDPNPFLAPLLNPGQALRRRTPRRSGVGIACASVARRAQGIPARGGHARAGKTNSRSVSFFEVTPRSCADLEVHDRLGRVAELVVSRSCTESETVPVPVEVMAALERSHDSPFENRGNQGSRSDAISSRLSCWMARKSWDDGAFSAAGSMRWTRATNSRFGIAYRS